MAIILSKHLAAGLSGKRVTMAYIEAAIAHPDWTRPDPNWPGVTRSFKAIPAFGGRVLRVAHRPSGVDIFVITAHWDRGAKP
jgi:hypothetical protein